MMIVHEQDIWKLIKAWTWVYSFLGVHTMDPPIVIAILVLSCTALKQTIFTK
jgi:hypothetical protein